MQTILGSGGSIGNELAKELVQYTGSVRLVSRNPVKINDSDQLLAADLTKLDEVDKAVRGSRIVYLTVGFPYTVKTWNQYWPPLMENLIESCKKYGSKLVFFDNVYMYDPRNLGRMTEETPINPSSRKGEIRARIADRLMDESRKGNIQALIARSADFYGPSIRNSILMETVFTPLSQGKKATWLGRDDVRHSFTYTPDAGKATAILGNSDQAYGEVWHLPTAADPMTGQEWVRKVASQLNTEAKHRLVSRNLLRLAGLFNSDLRESVEMIYQFDRPYIFDSSKFENKFNFLPTTYGEGIKHIIGTGYR